jgi:putative solute:sodium symporter small subunit
MWAGSRSSPRYPVRMNHVTLSRQQFDRKVRRLTWASLVIWAGVTLVPIYGARRLNFELWGWPFNFWMAAQGCVLVYLALVVYFAWQVNRWEATLRPPAPDARQE